MTIPAKALPLAVLYILRSKKWGDYDTVSGRLAAIPVDTIPDSCTCSNFKTKFGGKKIRKLLPAPYSPLPTPHHSGATELI